MNKMTFASFQNIVFFLFLALVSVFFAYILQPFFFAIFWAVLVAAIFAPLNRLINRKTKSPNIAAGLTLVAVVLAMVLPVSLLISLLIAESIDIYSSLQTSSGQWIETIQKTFSFISNHPFLAKLQIDEEFITGKLVEVMTAVSDFLVRNLTSLTQNTVVFILQFAVMLYCLYYFLRDGEKLVDNLTDFIPVNKGHVNIFIHEFLSTAKATLKFTFVIGGIQGFLGGLVFFIVGIEGALVWGVLMLGLSILPAVGCSIIWVPAGIVLLIQGQIWQGLAVLIFGAVVISSVDTLLRPVLMGKDIKMHSLLIFLSTLGGLSIFGVSGFVLGPVIASLFLAIWKLFFEIYRQEEAPAENTQKTT